MAFIVHEVSGFAMSGLISVWNKDFFFLIFNDEIDEETCIIHFQKVVLESKNLDFYIF